MTERNITPHYISSCDIDPILFFSNLAVDAEPAKDAASECNENESLVNVIEELCGLRELDWKTNSPFNAISQWNYPLFAVSRNGRMIAPGSDMSAYTDQIVCHNDPKTFLPIKHSEHAEINRSNSDNGRKKVALSVDVGAACSNEIRPVTCDDKRCNSTFRTEPVSANMNVSPSPSCGTQDEVTDSEETVLPISNAINREQNVGPSQIPSLSSSPFSEESTSSHKSSATSTEIAKKKAPSTAKRKRASSVSPAHSASLQEYGLKDTFAYVQSTVLRRTNRVHTYEQIKQALLRYQELNGNILVPYKFRIPVGSPIWSEDSAGIWLGKVVRNIRCGHCYCTKKAELESLGFVFAKQPKGNYAKVELALLTYQEIFGTMDVKYTFKVPVGDSSWPLETWGMKLGKSVRNIRCGHNYRDRQADLAQLGLKFKKAPSGPTSTKPDPPICPLKIEPDPDPTPVPVPVIGTTPTLSLSEKSPTN